MKRANTVIKTAGIFLFIAGAYFSSGFVMEVVGLLWHTREQGFDGTGFSKIYTLVEKGQIVPDKYGYAKLPEQFAPSTKHGTIYVTRKGNLLMVLFPVWNGKGSNLRGYLYTSRPLNSADTHKGEYLGVDDAVDVHVPGQEGSSYPTVLTEVLLKKKMSGTIYYVSRSLD
jgi:hypothetical protein